MHSLSSRPAFARGFRVGPSGALIGSTVCFLAADETSASCVSAQMREGPPEWSTASRNTRGDSLDVYIDHCQTPTRAR